MGFRSSLVWRPATTLKSGKLGITLSSSTIPHQDKEPTSMSKSTRAKVAVFIVLGFGLLFSCQPARAESWHLSTLEAEPSTSARHPW